MKNLMQMYGKRVKRKYVKSTGALETRAVYIVQEVLEDIFYNWSPLRFIEIDVVGLPILEETNIGEVHCHTSVFVEVSLPYFTDKKQVFAVAEIGFSGVGRAHSRCWKTRHVTMHLVNATFPDGCVGFVSTTPWTKLARDRFMTYAM